jgi:hypothetical protein
MKNQQKFLQHKTKVTQEALRIKGKLKDIAKPTMLHAGVINVLEQLDDVLEQTNKADRETFERFAFSIYRLTTDDFEFAQSPIGQELLKLGEDLRNLSREV